MDNKNYVEHEIDEKEMNVEQELLEEIEEAVTATALGCSDCCG